MDGHPEVGADTLASALQLHRRHRAAAAARRAWTGWRRCSRTPRCGCRCPQELDDSLEADARGAAAARACCGARTASGSRCGPSSASSTTGSSNTLRPRGREPGYADAQALRRDLELVLAHLNSRHVALGLDPAAAVAGRRLRLPPRRDRHPPGRGRRARGDAARCCPATPTPTRPRRQALLTEALGSGRRGIQHDPGGEAGELLRVLDTVALSAEAYGPQAGPRVRDLDDRAAVRRARRRPGSRARARATSLRMVPLFETRAALEQAPATMAELYACEPYVAHLRAQAQPPDGDGRLLGLGQGHGLRRLDVGALQRPGAARGAGARGGRRARALPRPRRLALARRRAHLPRHPGPARGHRAGADPDHRAGRDGLRPLRRRGARRALARADGLGRAAGHRAAEPAGPRRVARGDGAALGALARALPRRWSTTTRSSCASSARSRRSPSSPSSTSARARRRARATPTSSRCARSRGSSPGRRTGCCCRRGTARARRWPRATSSSTARCGATGRSSAG